MARQPERVVRLELVQPDMLAALLEAAVAASGGNVARYPVAELVAEAERRGLGRGRH